ncbi:hypothetical protein JCM19294_150 [Nonlabens tegetincola]|uniref:Uncharacterized protein n=1 Tax=Nonlabens tegetincola TaxID=323273 RepID=A0A090Q3F1_9FLAO|nr:hypothetical protein JCM19294_150 [Nonlabens tegetincola]
MSVISKFTFVLILSYLKSEEILIVLLPIFDYITGRLVKAF